MTDEMIIKALECCALEKGCGECPANPHRGNYGFCTAPLIKGAYDLINRLQQEIRQLHIKLDDCERDIIPKLKYHLKRSNQFGAETYGENIRLLEENERLNKILDFYLLQYGTVTDQSKKIAEIKAEAIKDFAERLKAEKFTHKNFGELVYVEDIDNLVKEMIGEQQ